MIVKKITLLGHKDHGKSTLIGNMLILTDRVNPAKLADAQRTSSNLGKRFEPGFILDSFHEEREGGLTIDTTRTEKIPHRGIAFEFIDVPGHEELIKNMMSGASQADIAVLIISAKSDEGIMDQTKRHLFVARMLGIRKLVVAVNKMDMVGYKMEKFEEIRGGMEKFIEHLGFRISDVYFVPISAYKKDNIITRSSNMKWYTGKPLIDLLYINAKMEDVKKDSRELKVVLQGFIDPAKEFIAGKVISGKMQIGDNIRIWPAGFRSSIKKVIIKGASARMAKPGTSVAFGLKDRIGSEVRGSVMTDSMNAPRLGNSFKANIFVIRPIRTNMKIKFNNVDFDCKSIKVLRCIDTRTGKRKEGSNRIKALDAIEAEVKLDRKLPFESYDKTQELGRFLFYSGGEFAGIGTIE